MFVVQIKQRFKYALCYQLVVEKGHLVWFKKPEWRLNE